MDRIRLSRASIFWLLAATVMVALAGCSAPAATASRPQAAAPTAATASASLAAAPTTATAPRPPTAAPTAGAAEAPAAAGGEAGGGDEPTVTYTDSSQHFQLSYPRSWGKTTQPGEAIRLTGRDEFISVAVVSTTQAPLDYAKTDVAQLSAASPVYKSTGPRAYTVAGASGAMIAYTWQAGPSPVTGKQVPSSANRYYIPGPGGKLAVFTYSTPTTNYDPAGADDFANAFRWQP